MLKNPTTFPEKDGDCLIAGPAGMLELKTHMPNGPSPHHVGIVCHPNPQQEGTMHNKVVHTIARAFERLGACSVRFNYRGVGQSEGTFGEVTGELADLEAVLYWTRKCLPDTPIWLAGFSFGSYIAARTAMDWPIDRLLSVAPAVHLMDYQTLEMTCPWAVAIAMDDEVAPATDIQAWLATMPDIEVIEVAGASHFFHKKLIPLREEVEKYFGAQDA